MRVTLSKVGEDNFWAVYSRLTRLGPVGQSRGDSKDGSQLGVFPGRSEARVASPRPQYLAMRVALSKVDED